MRSVKCHDDASCSVPMVAAQADEARGLIRIQGTLVLFVGVFFLIASGYLAALSSLYGGGMALLSVWLLARRIRMASVATRDRPGREVGILYVGAIRRFVLMFCLFVLGMTVFSLDPVPMIIGFGVPQVAFMVGARFRGSHDRDH